MLMLHIYFGINEAFFIVSTSPMKNSLSIEIRCHSILLTSMPHHVVYNLWSFVTFSRWLEGLIVACITECDFISTNYNWMNIGYNVMKFAKQNKLTRVRVLIKRKLKKKGN